MMRFLAIGLLVSLTHGCQWGIERVTEPRDPVGPPALVDEPFQPRHVLRLEPPRPFLRRNEPERYDDGFDIDWSFITVLEGRGHDRAYVPVDRRTGQVLGKSGVTVASGFDLGQHHAGDLRRMGVDDALADRLAPYLGLQGKRAGEFLAAHPLALDANEVARLDRAKHLDTAAKVARTFDRSRAPRVPAFAALTRSQRTVITSVALQYGTRLHRRAPTFWSCVVEGRFADAAAELRRFGDGFATRRAREAALLERDPAAQG